MLNNQARDIEALSGFSDTLNKFLFKKAEQKNEADMKLGIAEVLNGNITPKPETFVQYKEAENQLANAASQEAALSDQVAQVSPAVAEQHRADSKAISGWRAYGQAIGKTKLAASGAQTIMTEFMESEKEVVPIPQLDGSVKLIAPRDAKTPAEIMAAYAVGQQMFIDQAGISRVNPVLIAEHLTPTMMAVKQNIVSNRVASARKEAQEEAVETVKTRIGAEVAILDATDPEAIQRFWQETTRDLNINGRIGKGAANEAVVKAFIDNAKALGRTDLLEALAQTPLIADQPNGPTVGDRFRAEFEEAARGIEAYNDFLEKKVDEEQDSMVDDLISAHQLLLTQPGIGQEQIKGSWTATTAELRRLAGAGNKKATEALGEFIQQGENYNPFLAADLARDIAQGRYPSEASIDEAVRRGQMTASEASDLKNKLPSSEAVERTKTFEKEIQQAVRGLLAEAFVTQGIERADALAAAPATLIGQMTDELSELVQTELEKNPKMSPAEVRDFYKGRAEALLKQPRFTPTIDKNGRITVPASLSNNPRINKFLNPVTGKQTRDFTSVPPASAQTMRPSTGSDWLINSQELAQNTQNYLNGQGPTPRVAALMRATGKSYEQILRDQSKAYGIPFTQLSQSQASQAAQQRRSLAPAAAALLVNPNATPAQRIRAWNDINAAKQRQLRRDAAGKTMGPGQDLKPGSTVQISDYLRLAKAQGLNDEQAALMAAVGMAESTGNSGIVNNNPNTGDNSYGLWQINMIGDLGPARLRQFGLRSNEDLKDPETNARVMAEILKSQGINAWGAYKDQRYRQYLPEARRALAEMRRSGFSSARSGGRANFTPQNVQSIRIETQGGSFQPGLDLWFADKQFGAFLPGRVKEIRQNAGNYGNLVIVESVDPETGDRIDVLYSHLDNINVREGQRINVGTVVGQQGGTGRVRSADGTIASVDFLAPAPRGSNSMTPYPRWRTLAERIKTRIESGSL
jgi:murein DD-endopeptidase MepM/ murein hydrolase activator NlpD